MNPVLALSGASQAQLVRTRAISSAELIDAHLSHIDAINPQLNAAVEILYRTARAAARESDRRAAANSPLSPLDGVPFSVKNSIEIAGTVCTAGTLGFRNAAPSTRDATLVARLRAAGAIPIAHTNLPDLLFAFESDNLIHGRTNNPYDLTCTPGGSSGGESALIAACGSPFGLGSDCAGSVRLPAHYCGISSLKPTSGRLARTGHVPAAGGWIEAIWQIGPMARRVEDLQMMLPILLGPDGEDHTVIDMPLRESPVPGLRVAFFTENGFVPSDSDTARVVRDAARALEAAGCIVEERRPPGIEETYDLEMSLIGPDGADSLRAYLAEIGSTQIHPLLEGWLVKHEPYRTTLAGFADYWARLHAFRARMHAFLQNYDAILSPVSATPALPHRASIEDHNFRGFSYTMTYNLTGLPAAVVRCGQSPAGLPINVQLAAHPFREDVALALAATLETALGGWRPSSFGTPL